MERIGGVSGSADATRPVDEPGAWHRVCGPTPFPPARARAEGRWAGVWRRSSSLELVLMYGSPIHLGVQTKVSDMMSAVGPRRQMGTKPSVRSRDVLETAAERSRVTWHGRVSRLRRLAPTLLMGAIAAGAAWYIATKLVGDRGAFFAPIAAIITLGLTVGSRLNRAIELSIGVPLGIALADVVVLEVGSGTLQLIGIVFLATGLAVFVGGGALLTTQAAVSAILVVTLQPPTNGLSFTRAADALIGCGVALLLNFVVAPIDPIALARREAAPVLRALAAVLDDIAVALVARDRDRAVAALRHARDIDAHTQRFLEALTIGRETAAAAPVRWTQREPLAVYSEAGGQIDLAVRNVRVLARGVLRAIETEDRVPPEVADSLYELRQAVLSLVPWMEDPRRVGAVVEPAVQAARHASAVLEQTTNLSVSVIVGQIRSTAVDLLRTTGIEPAEARARIRGDTPVET